MATNLLRLTIQLCRILIFLLGIGIILGAIPAYQSEYDKDHSVANVKALIMVVFGAAILIGNASLLPRLHWSRRLLILLTPLLIAVLFLTLCRFTGFSGEMLPVFAWRWSSIKNPLQLKKGTTSESIPDSPLALKYDLTKLRFNQFLGTHRDGVIRGISMDPDWGRSPPELLWKHAIGAGWSGIAIDGRRAVTLEQRTTDGFSEEWISCYELFTGILLWQHSYRAEHFDPIGGRGPRATPLIVDDSVFCQGATGIINRIRLDNGEPVWEASLLKQAGIDENELKAVVSWGRSGSPLLVADRLIVPFGGNVPGRKALVAFDANLGTVLWKNGADQIGYSSPIYARLAGVEQIVSVNENTVTGSYLQDGATIWSYEWPGSSSGSANISQPVVISDNRVLLSKGYGAGATVIELSPSPIDSTRLNVARIWSDENLLKTKFTSSLYKDGFAYGISDGILECVNLETGKRAWKKGRFGQGQMLLVGGHLLILAEDGRIVMVNADSKEFKQVSEFQVLQGTTWNTPAIAGPFILVRNAQEIACLRIPLLNDQNFHLKISKSTDVN